MTAIFDTMSGNTADVIADFAASLPVDIFADRWRTAEPWLALIAEREGGERYLRLPGLIDAGAATGLRRAVKALPFNILKTELLTARRCLLEDGAPEAVAAWLEVMASPALRALCGAVLGRPLPPGLVVNAWRLQEHDFMGVHPDGVYYRGTLSIGLNPLWDKAMGGAIAFGTPTEEGFDVADRWYPLLGDGLLFAPDVDTWHAVEPVVGQHIRLSLTGWWVAPDNALSNRAAAEGAL